MSKVRVRYQTIEFGELDIHLRTLRDNQQFADEEQEAEALGISSAQWPLFGLVWESGELLARIMHSRDVDGLSVLEVGCGIGLASLVLQQRNADITATDLHPEAGRFLSRNAELNELAPIPFVQANWNEPNRELGRFDLIVGSDLLYEQPNIQLLADFIERHAAAHCVVIIVDPGRGMASRFTRRMTEIGYLHNSSTPANPEHSASFSGRIMTFTRKHNTPMRTVV